MTPPQTVYDLDATGIDGATVHLDAYRGQVLLIVNVASRCGYTPQYAGLEQLYRQFRDRGFAVLGFPCDQFGGQEPGSDAEIRRFCAERYDVTFPLFAKIEVNGPGAHPLYRWLKSQKGGRLGIGRIAWNFTKFLIARDGRVVARFGTATTPQAIAPEIASALAS